MRKSSSLMIVEVATYASLYVGFYLCKLILFYTNVQKAWGVDKNFIRLLQ